jgi:excisionase family DNA binding protein
MFSRNERSYSIWGVYPLRNMDTSPSGGSTSRSSPCLNRSARPHGVPVILLVSVSTLPTQILLVSQYDAARLLGVERTTIWRMCGRGDLARVRIGRRTLITMDSIKAFIALQVECVGDQ